MKFMWFKNCNLSIQQQNTATLSSDSARHLFQDICPPISQIVLKNFMS